MSDKVKIGVCSICGGDVTTPHAWRSIVPPPPEECSRCGATRDEGWPIIVMTRRRPPPDGWKVWSGSAPAPARMVA